MSQPSFPRTFTFVGGPSRKRRREAAPLTCEANRTPQQPTHAARAVATTKDGKRNSQTTSAILATSETGLRREGNDNGVAPSLATINDQASLSTGSVTPPTHNSPDDSQLDPPGGLESLQEWQLPSPPSMVPEGLESALEFDNAFYLSSHYFHMSSLSSLSFPNAAAPESITGSSEESFREEENVSSLEDLPSEGPFDSAEDISRIKPIVINISDKFLKIFAQYDQEFCVWPLTHDFEANPFRYDLEIGQGSPLLWHSTLALSYKHIHRATGTCLGEAKVHKKKAVQLLTELEASLGCERLMSALNYLSSLANLLLKCATSAHGPWIAHLRRAQKIIETLEKFEIKRTPRIQAQIEMLVWWDVTLGLTSRRGFTLSGSTINSVLSPEHASDFYNISGCPAELFQYMFQLGTYAREFELASHMTCVTFDMGPVLAVEKALKQWRTPCFDDPDADFDDPVASSLPNDWNLTPIQTAHYLQDLYYCAQAWRFALLIYIERVFKWRRGEASMTRISLFARKTLNNMLSCRQSVMIQKQLLLPVFLAACETEDAKLRNEARNYCKWWASKTRYEMFITSLGLLEEVWAATDPDSWWGALIDQKFRVGSTRQYLFG
ncbi:fungal-specific transcription factor domain-containing protein [Hypoxylon cercidicola]|nr:fungal-specific transcription factor domain-containing protein [Hypoxylon cercidicola]